MANDHYVPQFYLRNFEIKNPSHPIPKKHVCSYKRGFLPIFKAIKSIASELDFDAFEENEQGLDDETYNKLLKVSEDSAPTIISEILRNTTFSITEENKEILSWFIALLAIRTPTAHQYFTQDILNYYENILQPRIQKDCISNKLEIYKALRSETPNITDEEVEDTIKFLLENNFNWQLPNNDNNKGYLRGTGVAHINFLVNYLMSMNWHLLVIKGHNSFITSDNPVSFLFPRMEIIRNTTFCLSPIFLPLSPKKALYIHHYNFFGDLIFLDDNQIDFFVMETINRAKDYLYGDFRSDKLQANFDSTQFNLANFNYKYVFMPYYQLKGMYKSAFKHFAETRND